MKARNKKTLPRWAERELKALYKLPELNENLKQYVASLRKERTQ